MGSHSNFRRQSLKHEAGIFRRRMLQDDTKTDDSSKSTEGEVRAVPKTTKKKKRKRKKRTTEQIFSSQAAGASDAEESKNTAGVAEKNDGDTSSEKAASSDQNKMSSAKEVDPAGGGMSNNTTEKTVGPTAVSKESNATSNESSAAKPKSGAKAKIEKEPGEEKEGKPENSPSVEGAQKNGGDTEKSASSVDSKVGESDPEDGGPESAMQKVARLQSEKAAKATKFQQMKRDLRYLEKSLELKRGERQAASSQVELDEDEIRVSMRQLQEIKETEERTSSTYQELKTVTSEMKKKAKSLSTKAGTISDLTQIMTARMQNLTVEEVLANSARGLPDSVAGAIRRSAEALTPFMDTLMIAVDTNQRLVDHVGMEIDKITHVNIKKSPFLSGIVFYCVLLIPTLTLVSFARRVFDSSSHLTVSHFIVFGNIYYMSICFAAILTSFIIKEDPAASLHRNHENVFVTFNLLLALYYIWHVGIMSLQAAYTREKRNAAQLTATLCIGLHYFLFTWRRIFTRASPAMIAANYGMYLTILYIITAERVNRVDMTPLWLRRHQPQYRNASRDPSSTETTLGSILLLLSKNLLAPFTGGKFNPFKGYKKMTWDSAPRNFRNRQTLLRSAQSDDDFELGDMPGRDLEASQARRPQSARLAGNSATTRPKRRPLGQPAAEKRGFPAMLFGSKNDGRDDDVSDEDVEDESGERDDLISGWWDRITRATGYPAQPPRPNRRMSGRSTGATSEVGRGRQSASNRGPARQQTFYDSWFGGNSPETPRRDR